MPQTSLPWQEQMPWAYKVSSSTQIRLSLLDRRKTSVEIVETWTYRKITSNLTQIVRAPHTTVPYVQRHQMYCGFKFYKSAIFFPIRYIMTGSCPDWEIKMSSLSHAPPSADPSSGSHQSSSAGSYLQSLEGYEYEFDPPVGSRYECPICLLVLREPSQTKCGHRFCKECILRTLK